MKFFPLIAALSLSACSINDKYTQLTVSNYQGKRIATWVAEGHVKPHDLGYRIRAVERVTAEPNTVHNRYPNGWMVTVTGPNIVRERIEKPDWLKQLDGEL